MAHWRLRSEQHLPHETLNSLEGRLCLGLVNTAHPRSGRHAHDSLTGYSDLVGWNRSVGMLSEEQEQHLLQEASAHPHEALKTFECAFALREAIYRVFSAVASGSVPRSEDLGLIQSIFAEAMAHASLFPTAHAFSWEWGVGDEHGEDLRLLLWPVAHSAIELLTSAEECKRIKECPGCGWLFLDASKTGNRRWCSMDECGSRAKMRRQYARKRSTP
jgi:predicted RNA-binding Zn ribbon-like protein